VDYSGFGRAYKVVNRIEISPVKIKMIISNIIGGLGNQMFQFAAARALSLARTEALLLDIYGFSGYGLHQGFELHRVFDCQVKIANERDIHRILDWQFPPLIRRIVRRPAMAVFRRDAFVVEPHFHYWSALNQVPSDCYLTGYWQSEKYFQAYAATIRADFSFKQAMMQKNAELADKISGVTAISLHVRRGDYVKNLKTAANHGLCSLDYYRSAIKYVAERVDTPFFFVFSDDPVWVKENLQIDFPCRYIDHNQGAESYNDMRLMSLCKHHIIANSSFSWWGAWLNARNDKIVIAPKKWFANANDVSDLFPEGWVTL
jgi:hypothetical protein